MRGLKNSQRFFPRDRASALVDIRDKDPEASLTETRANWNRLAIDRPLALANVKRLTTRR